MSVLGQVKLPMVICNPTELASEINQRLPYQNGSVPSGPSSAALWVEPLADTWEAELINISRTLSPGALLVTIVSQPAARLLPERRGWIGSPLGFQLGGLNQLRRALARAGFNLTASYGIHTASAIGFSLLSQLVERLGRADLGDRLHFAASLHYCSTRSMAGLAMVALLFARREPAS